MTDPDYAAIMLLVDRSGSMAAIRATAQDSLNEFIRGQAAEFGRRTIRLAQFDDRYDLVHESIPAVEALGRYQLEPLGRTALLDAMGRSITEFGDELAALPEEQRPGTVYYVVLTDGAENASQEWTYDRVHELITRQRDTYGWHVLYLGADENAIKEAARFGFRSDQSIRYAATDVGTQSVITTASAYVTRNMGRAGGQSIGFTDQERTEASGLLQQDGGR